MTRSLCRFVAYVRHPQVPDYLRAGWMPLDDLGGTRHGEWSILMGWPHEGEMVLPKKDAA